MRAGLAAGPAPMSICRHRMCCERSKTESSKEQALPLLLGLARLRHLYRKLSTLQAPDCILGSRPMVLISESREWKALADHVAAVKQTWVQPSRG